MWLTFHAARIDVHRMDGDSAYLLALLSIQNQTFSHMVTNAPIGVSAPQGPECGKGLPSCKELMSMCKLVMYA